MAATPTSPSSRPAMFGRPICSRRPNAAAATQVTSGTAEMRRPASELEMCCSAFESINQGMPISIAANATSGSHNLSRGRTWPRASAMGSKTRAPTAVRANTSTTGGSSLTAMRMKRYGMPQMTHIAMKRRRARRDMNGTR